MRARHLSPIFGSQTPIAPELEDMMVIDEIPDIFHVGHVHVMELDTYRGVLLVNSGAWQKQTPFQVSVGQTPTPGLAVMVNLQTASLSGLLKVLLGRLYSLSLPIKIALVKEKRALSR